MINGIVMSSSLDNKTRAYMIIHLISLTVCVCWGGGGVNFTLYTFKKYIKENELKRDHNFFLADYFMLKLDISSSKDDLNLANCQHSHLCHLQIYTTTLAYRIHISIRKKANIPALYTSNPSELVLYPFPESNIRRDRLVRRS